MDEERETALRERRPIAYFYTLAELITVADRLAIPPEELYVHGTIIPMATRAPARV